MTQEDKKVFLNLLKQTGQVNLALSALSIPVEDYRKALSLDKDFSLTVIKSVATDKEVLDAALFNMAQSGSRGSLQAMSRLQRKELGQKHYEDVSYGANFLPLSQRQQYEMELAAVGSPSGKDLTFCERFLETNDLSQSAIDVYGNLDRIQVTMSSPSVIAYLKAYGRHEKGMIQASDLLHIAKCIVSANMMDYIKGYEGSVPIYYMKHELSNELTIAIKDVKTDSHGGFNGYTLKDPKLYMNILVGFMGLEITESGVIKATAGAKLEAEELFNQLDPKVQAAIKEKYTFEGAEEELMTDTLTISMEDYNAHHPE